MKRWKIQKMAGYQPDKWKGWNELMEREEKLRSYERMQAAIQTEYDRAVDKMEQMKAEGKAKTVTYRQLMGKKLLYKDMLAMYELYGLQVK